MPEMPVVVSLESDGGTGLPTTRRTRVIFSRQRITSASAVLIGTTAAINVLRIVNTMLLTRLLAPTAFGLIGIILSIFTVINMVTDAGFQAFIIRHARGLEPKFLDSIWTIHISRAICNSAIALSLSYPLSWLLNKPQLAPLLAVASLTLAIDGTASLTLMTSLREGLVRRLSFVDLVSFIIQFVAGITAAWFLRSAWAIIFSMYVASITRVLASYLVFPQSRRRLRIDRELFAELWRFSRMIAASSALTLVIGQVDKLLFARIWSLRDFGVYIVAANLAAAPVALAGMYAGRIIYPAIAQVWRTAPATLGGHYYALRGLVFYGYLLGAGALGGGARLIVGILYDHRYQGASIFLRLLAITTAMTMITRPPMKCWWRRVGCARHWKRISWRVAWLVVALPIGLMWLGPIGAVAALALIEIPAYAYSARKLIHYDLFSPRHELLAFATIAAGAADRLVGKYGRARQPVATLMPVSDRSRRALHVGLYSPALPSYERSNGIVTYVRVVRKALLALGHRVTVIAPAGIEWADGRIEAAAPDRSAAALLERALVRFPARGLIRPRGGGGIARLIRATHRRDPFDVFEMEESFGWSAQLGLDVPVITRLHGPHFLGKDDEETPEQAAASAVRIAQEGRAIARAQGITSPSPDLLAAVMKHYQIAPRSAEVIYNPIAAAPPEECWSIDRCDPDQLLFVGRFDQRKGADIALEAFALAAADHPKLRLVMCGPDRGIFQPTGERLNFSEYLASRVAPELHARIDYKGALPQRNRPPTAPIGPLPVNRALRNVWIQHDRGAGGGHAADCLRYFWYSGAVARSRKRLHRSSWRRSWRCGNDHSSAYESPAIGRNWRGGSRLMQSSTRSATDRGEDGRVLSQPLIDTCCQLFAMRKLRSARYKLRPAYITDYQG